MRGDGLSFSRTKGRRNAHTCALCFDVFSSLPSKLQGKPGEPFNSQCHCPARSSTRPENLFAYDRLPFQQSSFAKASEDNPLRAPRLRVGGARRDRTDDLMLAKHALYQLSYGPIGSRPSESLVVVDQSARGVTRSVVGPGRLELPTSRLSGVCSNQLSYRPLKRHIQAIATYSRPRYAIAPQPHRLQCHAERETKTATLCYLHSVCERTNRA